MKTWRKKETIQLSLFAIIENRKQYKISDLVQIELKIVVENMLQWFTLSQKSFPFHQLQALLS